MEEDTDTDCPQSSRGSGSSSSTNQTETCGSSLGNGQAGENDSFIQQLFLICDQDGDGFISSSDLIKVLNDMGLEETVDVNQILVEMGGSSNGQISYDQFVQCLISVRGDIEKVQVYGEDTSFCFVDDNVAGNSLAVNCSGLAQYSDAESQGYSTFGTNSLSYCSGEVDSGARDCSPERFTTDLAEQRDHADCDVLLNFANKLHIAALVSLRNEVEFLQTKLRQSEIEIKRLNEHLMVSENEKVKLVNQFEESLESQNAMYEERMTELHSILAEVQKKSNSVKDNAIMEEDEEDYSEDSSCPKQEDRNKAPGLSLSLIPRPVTQTSGPVVENLCIKQAHVSKVVSRDSKPTPPPRTDSSKSNSQKALELDVEVIKSSHNNLSALNDVLIQNLEESRSQGERFFSLLLKYESVVGTQQLTIDASRKLCDAYEYLVKLLDMKNTVKRSTLQLSGDSKSLRCQECRSRSLKSASSESSLESRPDSEELFSRLNGSADSRFLEKKLRLLIEKLDEERKSYEGLADMPETPVASVVDETKFATTASTEINRKGDLEMTVLVQEIMGLKEERAELRCRVHQLERKEEGRVVPKYFPDLARSLEALESAKKQKDMSDLGTKVEKLVHAVKGSSLAYQAKEDDLVQTISKMKHVLKFLVQLIGKQKRDSQSELQSLDELMQKIQF